MIEDRYPSSDVPRLKRQLAAAIDRAEAAEAKVARLRRDRISRAVEVLEGTESHAWEEAVAEALAILRGER